MAWGLLLALGCSVPFALARAGAGPLASYLGAVTLLQVLVLALEARSPLRAAWRESDGQRAHDLGHWALSVLGAHALTVALVDATALPLHGALVRAAGGELWPDGAPRAAQLVLALLASELGMYAQHRAAHRWGWLWRFHAVHHEGSRLDVLKATRQHPVDFGTANLASLAPLALLGAPGWCYAMLGALSAAVGLLQHANVALPTPGWLDAWVCTPKTHRLHHAKDLRDGNQNFGVVLMVYDQLFGTFTAPRALAPDAVGLHDPQPARSFADELLGRFAPAAPPR